MVNYNHNVVNRILSILIFLLVSCENLPNVQDAGTKSEASQNVVDNAEYTEIDQSDKYNSKIDESVVIQQVYPYRRATGYGYSKNIEPEVSIKVDFINISKREIKYIYFKYRAKNGVGDYINSDDEIDPTFEESKATGPFKPLPLTKDYKKYTYGELWELNWDVGKYWWKYENRWRNYNIKEVEILISKIEFSDGTIIQGHGETYYSDKVFEESYD